MPRIDTFLRRPRNIAFFLATRLAAAAVALSPLVLAEASAQNWTTYAGDVAHTGRVDFDPPLETPLKVLWHRHVTTYDGEAVFDGYPLIVGELIYLSLRDTASGGRNRIEALDLKSGKPVWTYRDPDWSSRSLQKVAGAKSLIVENGHGKLIALDLQTGAEIWRTPIAATYHPTLLAAQGEVFVPEAGYILALSELDGHQTWSSAGDQADFDTDTGLSFDGETLFANRSCRLVALDPGTGAHRWHIDNGCDGPAIIVSTVFKKRIYLPDMLPPPSEDGTWVYHRKKQIWFKKRTWWSPTFFNGTIFLLEAGYLPDGQYVPAATLAARSEDSYELKWRFKLKPGRRFMTSPVMINGNIILADEYAHIYVIDAHTGALKHQLHMVTKGRWIEWIVAGNGVILVSSENRLLALTFGAR